MIEKGFIIETTSGDYYQRIMSRLLRGGIVEETIDTTRNKNFAKLFINEDEEFKKVTGMIGNEFEDWRKQVIFEPQSGKAIPKQIGEVSMTNPFTNENQSYLVTGFWGTYPDNGHEVLYVGNVIEEARDFMLDGRFHTLELDVWANGVSIRGYSRKLGQNSMKWTLEYDRMIQIQAEIKEKELEKQKLDGEIAKLKKILESDK